MNAIQFLALTFLLGMLPQAAPVSSLMAQQSGADLRANAEQGDAAAQYKLGFQYDTGVGVPTNRIEAVKWYRKAAEQGLTEAQLILGFYYSSGTGVEKNEVEAATWYRKAAEQGNATAQYNLAVCYDNGTGVVSDYVEAVKWYRKAAEQNDELAQLNLGGCYDRGQGVTKDYAEAVKWYRRSAAQNCALSEFNLGYCYAEGNGVAKNMIEAIKWYRKAAQQNLAEAQYNLGVCYRDGQGVATNYVEAVKWFRKAADQNYTEAQYNLGYSYANGQGVARDLVEGYKWWLVVARKGNELAKQSLTTMAGWMTREQIVEANKRARNYSPHGTPNPSRGNPTPSADETLPEPLREALASGDKLSQLKLALSYYHGEGVEQDHGEAVKWFRKAAEQGDAEAQYSLGVCYARGHGVETNHAEAVSWFRKAAESGDINAQSYLGCCYAAGLGVARDAAEARKWFHNAAELGDSVAQHNLGKLYYNGDGVPKDYVQAYKWALLSAAQSCEDASGLVATLEAKMSPELIGEGQKLARNFKTNKATNASTSSHSLVVTAFVFAAIGALLGLWLVLRQLKSLKSVLDTSNVQAAKNTDTAQTSIAIHNMPPPLANLGTNPLRKQTDPLECQIRTTFWSVLTWVLCLICVATIGAVIARTGTADAGLFSVCGFLFSVLALRGWCRRRTLKVLKQRSWNADAYFRRVYVVSFLGYAWRSLLVFTGFGIGLAILCSEGPYETAALSGVGLGMWLLCVPFTLDVPFWIHRKLTSLSLEPPGFGPMHTSVPPLGSS